MSYQYKEFPLWVEHEAGERRIVDSQEQFESLGDGWKKPADFVTPGFGPGRVLVEYPKWIGDVLVNNAEEEAALTGPIDDEDSTDPLTGGASEADEKAALVALAAEKGVSIDKRWNVAKIRDAIVMAEAP